MSPRPRTATTPGRAATPLRAARHARRRGEQLVVDRLDDGARGGARDGVAAERARVVAGLEARRSVVGDEQRADRQPVRERLGESHRVGADVERLPGEEGARPAQAASAPRRRRASRRARRQAPERPRGTPASSGITPPSPRTGSTRIAPMSGAGRGHERLVVVRRREADARRERLPGGALRGLAGDGERTERPAVEGALEGHDAALPGRLARPLERGLDRLGAGVAEERARAAKPVGEQPGQLRHRLGRVQVRDMPERSSWACAAASGAGCRWPSATTAIPASESR